MSKWSSCYIWSCVLDSTLLRIQSLKTFNLLIFQMEAEMDSAGFVTHPLFILFASRFAHETVKPFQFAVFIVFTV